MLHFLVLPTGAKLAFGAGWSGDPHVYHWHSDTLLGSVTLCAIFRCVFITTKVFGAPP